MEARDKLRKLSRYELIELIYELRKDNIALETQLREAESRQAAAQPDNADRLDQRLCAIEQALERLEEQLAQRSEH